MISGIYILYFPNLFLLERVLSSSASQLSFMYVIDNTPWDAGLSLNSAWFQDRKFNVVYKPLGENFGIAKAQNIGIDLAISDNNEHVIFFDQDSACSESMISILLDNSLYLKSIGFKVGAVGPLFIDEKTGEYSKAITHGVFRANVVNIIPYEKNPVKSDYIISSGSLISLDLFKIVGNMREDLFIDWVDIEWCLRANSFGYEFFIIPSAILKHSIGDEIIAIANKKINIHSDIRNYYIIRNATYLISQKIMGWKWRLNIILKIPQYIIFYTIFSTSNNRMNTFILLMRGFFHGLFKRLGKFIPD